MIQAIRHGDLCLVKIEELPKGLAPVSTNVMMQGSGGNDHAVKNGVIYLQNVDRFVFGFLVALPKCLLIHPDHGTGNGAIKTAPLEEGVYELRRQFEHTHDAMRQVVD
jgi:hypothetical protein